jgi:hypothetical protein
MDAFRKQSLEVQVVLGGSLLYLIDSFLDWQQVSFLNAHAGISEWHGVGVIAALLAIALLLWEAGRLLGARTQVGPITPGLGSIGLALLLLLFTVITFLTHNEVRHWPSWVGLFLSIAITAAAFRRARAEGVDVREYGAIASGLAAQVKASDGATGGGSPEASDEQTPDDPPRTGAQADA